MSLPTISIDRGRCWCLQPLNQE